MKTDLTEDSAKTISKTIYLSLIHIFCGSRISSGMEIEIKKAFQDQMAVFRYFPAKKQTLIPVKDWGQLDEMQIPVKDISE